MARGSRRSAAWLALVIASFVAALRLIDAPPAVAYQHYRFVASDHWRQMAWAVLLTNLLILVTVGRAHAVTAWRWARQSMSPAALLLLAAALVVTSAAPSKDPALYAGEMLFATAVQLLAVVTLIAAVRSVPERGVAALTSLTDRVLGEPGTPGPRRPDLWSLCVAAAVTGVAALLAALVYERHPHVPDEVAYLLHARYLAQGMLTMPLPPVPAAFNLDLLQYEPTRWYSPVPPGWPFVLAAGAWLGVPWLVNPILGGVAIVLSYLLLGELYDRRTARLALLLLAGSPWLLFMSMNLMTHTLTLVCGLAAALGVARSRRSGGLASAFLAGLFTGAVSLIRPLEGVAVAILLGVWSLGARGKRYRFAPSAILVGGAALTGALVFPYNRLLSGHAMRFPLMAYTDKYRGPGTNDLGFGPNRGLGWTGLDPFPGHGLRDVIVNALLNSSQVNVELFGWPTGSILAVGLLLALGMRGVSREDWWQVAVIGVVIGIHSFYWFSGGPDFGARYWYLIIVPCVALAARAIMRIDREPASGSTGALQRAPGRATGLAIGLVFLALLVYVPWRSLGKYHHYRGMRADVRDLARTRGFGPSLVLVRGRRHPDYASAAVYNPIDLRAGAPIYAWDAAPAIRALVLQAYADRVVWMVDGPSITGAGYRVTAGPLTVDQARVSRIPPSAAGDDGRVYDPVAPPAKVSHP